MDDLSLLEELRGRELRGGGWSFFGSRQVSLEATSLASLCLLAERPSEALRLGKLLSGAQLADGSWPSFVGDRESSWTTALAVCALNSVNDPSKARERGESWLLRTKGREGHWFWRWKFKTADRNVQFDPDKFGWPWISGSASWVIPTAFSIVAIKQFTVCNRSEESEKRIHAVVIAPVLTRIEMLRVARTYELCITRHKPVAVDARQRPKLEAEEVFRAKHGYLALELWGKDKELAGCVRPQFFTRSGEEVELPNGFDEAVKATTRGVNCLACSHPHFSRLVVQEEQQPPPAHEEEQESSMSADGASLAQGV
jgi:hypothetical protein